MLEKTMADARKLAKTFVQETEGAFREPGARIRKALSNGLSNGGIKDFTRSAVARFEKLNALTRERMSQAVNRLGIPTAGQIQKLSGRVDTLTRKVNSAQKSGKKGKRAS